MKRMLGIFLLALVVLACSSENAGRAGTGGEGGDGGAPVPIVPKGTPGLIDVVSANTISAMGTPFDINVYDQVGPDAHGAMYGRNPEIVPWADGGALYVAWRDHTSEDATKTFLVRLEKEADGVRVAHGYELMTLDLLIGFTQDANGDLYYATGVDEEVTVDEPAVGAFRPNIVRHLKFDRSGVLSYDIDVDIARSQAAEDPEQVIRPMVAATGRLAVNDKEVMLIHGINTKPDENDVRHQKALATLFDAATGDVLRVQTSWVSHSFDQRLLVDGDTFLELHLGDAYPRSVVLTRAHSTEVAPSHFLMHVKGETGKNNTFSRLGNLVKVTSESAGTLYDYLAVISTERTTSVSILPDAKKVAGARDIALLRVRRGFETFDKDDLEGYLDTSGSEAITVDSGGKQKTNHLRWLTSYGVGGAADFFAERPKLVAVSHHRTVVLWERWTLSEFKGTYAMVIDELGNTVVKETLITASHLPRGDDAIVWRERATWVTGDEAKRQLWIHTVDEQLNYERTIVE